MVDVGLLDVGCGESALHVETVHAEEELVAVEHSQNTLCHGAYGRLAGLAEIATEENHVEALVGEQFYCYVHCVGDNRKSLEFVEVTRNFEGGGTRVQEDSVAVVDERCGELADGLFLAEMYELFVVNVCILVGGYGATAEDCSAVGANDEISLVESVQVFAYGYL